MEENTVLCLCIWYTKVANASTTLCKSLLVSQQNTKIYTIFTCTQSLRQQKIAKPKGKKKILIKKKGKRGTLTDV